MYKELKRMISDACGDFGTTAIVFQKLQVQLERSKDKTVTSVTRACDAPNRSKNFFSEDLSKQELEELETTITQFQKELNRTKNRLSKISKYIRDHQS